MREFDGTRRSPQWQTSCPSVALYWLCPCSVSSAGAKLNTAADFMFAVVCLIKLPPVVSGFVMRRRFATVHSVLNRLAGLMLFALPLTLPFIALRYNGCVVCGIATLAAIQEGHIIRTGGGVVSVASKKRMKHNHTKNLPRGAQRNCLSCFPGPRGPVFYCPAPPRFSSANR